MTETDRELLELAARAAGYDYRPQNQAIVVDGIPANWNPLSDDGDEARLEAVLSLLVSWDEIGATWDETGVKVGGYVTRDGSIKGGAFEPYHKHPDKQAARRRAGVRAAAEIGKTGGGE